jgi:hypothetical protein
VLPEEAWKEGGKLVGGKARGWWLGLIWACPEILDPASAGDLGGMTNCLLAELYTTPPL